MKHETHEIKCLTEFYQAIEAGDKTFEIRKNDRDYNQWDFLYLHEVVGPGRIPTGRKMRRVVHYIMHGGQFGLPVGYVCMSIRKTS